MKTMKTMNTNKRTGPKVLVVASGPEINRNLPPSPEQVGDLGFHFDWLYGQSHLVYVLRGELAREKERAQDEVRRADSDASLADLRRVDWMLQRMQEIDSKIWRALVALTESARSQGCPHTRVGTAWWARVEGKRRMVRRCFICSRMLMRMHGKWGSMSGDLEMSAEFKECKTRRRFVRGGI